MYEKITNYINAVKSQVTVKRFIIGITSLLLICFVCSLIDGYLTARGNYQRALERLEQTQRELERSRRLNQELKLVIERSTSLNSQAGDRITRIEDYQRRTEQGIGRAQNYQQQTGAGIERLETNQRETGARIGDSLEHLDAARGEIERGLELIGRIERANQTQQTN